MLNIQIVEDDHVLSDGIRLALREADMDFVQSMSIAQAKADFEQNNPDLIILDINLPDGSGYDYLGWVRKQSEVPVLMLTANDMEMDEVMGLTLGADDYMTKPFSIAVLRARIQVLLRRNQGKGNDSFKEDGFFFNFGKLIFEKNGRELLLSVNEQKLLRYLVENKNRVMERSTLVDRLWSDGSEYVDENALSVTVNRLRSKLEEKAENVSYIQTVYGQGYMWKKKVRDDV
ncbi:MAG: response regulator transcription factor [Clostridia bacterium]|nr:response regulator transcription factor [Clostridia bacterium]